MIFELNRLIYLVVPSIIIMMIIMYISHRERVRSREVREVFLSISVLTFGVSITILEIIVRYFSVFFVSLFQMSVISEPFLGVILFHNYFITNKFLPHFGSTYLEFATCKLSIEDVGLLTL